MSEVYVFFANIPVGFYQSIIGVLGSGIIAGLLFSIGEHRWIKQKKLEKRSEIAMMVYKKLASGRNKLEVLLPRAIFKNDGQKTLHKFLLHHDHLLDVEHELKLLDYLDLKIKGHSALDALRDFNEEYLNLKDSAEEINGMLHSESLDHYGYKVDKISKYSLILRNKLAVIEDEIVKRITDFSLEQ